MPIILALGLLTLQWHVLLYFCQRHGSFKGQIDIAVLRKVVLLKKQGKMATCDVAIFSDTFIYGLLEDLN